MTINIEKAFDSLDHDFIIAAYNSYFGFKSNLIDWIKLLLNGQESRDINGGITNQYFELKRSRCEGDPIWANLFFILWLEILFILIKNKNIEGVSIFENTYLYTAYADESTVFLNNLTSVKELLDTTETFSWLAGLKPNLENVKFLE